jgi:hypothetical protein
MRDARAPAVADPQIAHNLSLPVAPRTVDNLLMKSMLLPGNEGFPATLRMDARGFLPTMKLQLSQLP